MPEEQMPNALLPGSNPSAYAPRRKYDVTDRLKRRNAQAVSIAYLAARSLAETTAMIMRDIALLPEDERDAVRKANDAAYQALFALNSIVIDAGNQESPRE